MSTTRKAHASNLNYSKRYLGHTYISSKCEVSQLLSEFTNNDVPFESFVLKAAQKAFSSAVNSKALDIKTVYSVDKQTTFVGIKDLRVGEIAA